MSAPATRDPLVVNTKDGAVWLRRAVTQDGRGLYAVTDSCNCPEYLMATLAELAEHGIAGVADVLPAPGGPQPSEREVAPSGIERLQVRVSELEAERLVTNEALSDAAEALRACRDRIAELEALEPAAWQTCRGCGAGYSYGGSCGVCAFQARMAAVGDVSPQVARLRSLLAGQRAAVGGPDALTRTFAPTQALPLEAEAAHVAPCRWPSSPECTCGGEGS